MENWFENYQPKPVKCEECKEYSFFPAYVIKIDKFLCERCLESFVWEAYEKEFWSMVNDEKYQFTDKKLKKMLNELKTGEVVKETSPKPYTEILGFSVPKEKLTFWFQELREKKYRYKEVLRELKKIFLKDLLSPKTIYNDFMKIQIEKFRHLLPNGKSWQETFQKRLDFLSGVNWLTSRYFEVLTQRFNFRFGKEEVEDLAVWSFWFWSLFFDPDVPKINLLFLRKYPRIYRKCWFVSGKFIGHNIYWPEEICFWPDETVKIWLLMRDLGYNYYKVTKFLLKNACKLIREAKIKGVEVLSERNKPVKGMLLSAFYHSWVLYWHINEKLIPEPISRKDFALKTRVSQTQLQNCMRDLTFSKSKHGFLDDEFELEWI